ncbi:hypothetical protein FOZ60_011997 [Perkinsus olseni]|uniref:Uncharacterized protein n=1 Tax=Perkinsus olseni TaxID=32597 RepID=A0A7J6PB65_PEROL|nr:hypothetical protein FOZ60_011997 [Perkinsus olseni]
MRLKCAVKEIARFIKRAREAVCDAPSSLTSITIMVVQVLYVKANLEGLSSITAPSDHYWCFDVAGSNTDEVRQRVTVNCMDEEEVPLIAFECRGCEITKWHPERGYTAVSEGGTVFDDVDLSDDWCDYDADNDAAVGVYDLEWKLERQ